MPGARWWRAAGRPSPVSAPAAALNRRRAWWKVSAAAPPKRRGAFSNGALPLGGVVGAVARAGGRRRVLAHAADDRLRRVGAAAPRERRVPHARGAPVPGRCPHPQRLPPAPAPPRPRDARGPGLSVPGIPRRRPRPPWRSDADERAPRRGASRESWLLDRRPPRAQRLHDRGGGGVDPLRPRAAASAPHRGGVPAEQRRIGAPIGEAQFRARGLRAGISLHRRNLAGPFDVRPPRRRSSALPASVGADAFIPLWGGKGGAAAAC